jgi:hypothetical protein
MSYWFVAPIDDMQGSSSSSSSSSAVMPGLCIAPQTAWYYSMVILLSLTRLIQAELLAHGSYGDELCRMTASSVAFTLSPRRGVKRLDNDESIQ